MHILRGRFGCPLLARARRISAWRFAPLALAALLLAGCSGKDIPDSWVSLIESESATPPAPPAECALKGDPTWADVPDADVRRDESARLVRLNKNRFRELAQRRRVCAAGLVAKTQGGK